MGEDTKIAWTHHTFNPWIGCTKVSPGCTNCYAEAQDHRWGHDRWGVGKPREQTSRANWKAPVKWNKQAEEAGERRRVFCASLADVFDDAVPIEWLQQLAALIAVTPHLDWLLLTKRPENFGRWPGGWPKNVWLGVTVENQESAHKRIDILLAQPVAVRFLSCEPLLEELNLQHWLRHERFGDGKGMGGGLATGRPSIDWLIVGGESGPKARPFNLAWARSLVQQCRKFGVSPFVKQLGACAVDEVNGLAGALLKVDPDAAALVSRRLKDRAGADPTEWPEDLRVREFPP